MARKTKILIRNGTTTPSAGDFETAEPAWDTTAGKLYIKDGAGSMVEIGAGGGGAVDYQEFTSSGTWTKPAGASTVYIEAIGPGAGGASGSRQAAGVVSRAGSGGSSGLRVWRLMQASDLAATVSVTVGVGSSGGAAVTTDSTNGASGANGNYCAFGSHLSTGRPQASAYNLVGSVAWAIKTGSATAGTEANLGGLSSLSGSGGASGYNTIYGPAGGGSGGGITSANVASSGGNGGGGFDALIGGNGALGGAGTAGEGGIKGLAGTSGTNGSTDAIGGSAPGSGGGGGGAGSAGTGGDGANGKFPGGGGGGGGSSRNGYDSGKGGDGADGVVRIWSW